MIAHVSNLCMLAVRILKFNLINEYRAYIPRGEGQLSPCSSSYQSDHAFLYCNYFIIQENNVQETLH